MPQNCAIMHNQQSTMRTQQTKTTPALGNQVVQIRCSWKKLSKKALVKPRWFANQAKSRGSDVKTISPLRPTQLKSIQMNLQWSAPKLKEYARVVDSAQQE